MHPERGHRKASSRLLLPDLHHRPQEGSGEVAQRFIGVAVVLPGRSLYRHGTPGKTARLARVESST
jgi:hypothetical protein